jgi:hypothetical protein
MQAKGLAPKALLSSIVCIKLHRNQGDTGQRPCVEDAFGTIKRNNLRMHRLMNQPPYCIIFGRKVGTGPMVEALDALIDGGLSASREPKEEHGGIDGTEGPGGASDGGPIGWNTCHHVIGPV